MHVRVNVPGSLKVDHRFHRGDVQPTRCHVGGYQHLESALLELLDHLVALSLEQVSMNGRSCKERVIVRAFQESGKIQPTKGRKERKKKEKKKMKREIKNRPGYDDAFNVLLSSSISPRLETKISTEPSTQNLGRFDISQGHLSASARKMGMSCVTSELASPTPPTVILTGSCKVSERDKAGPVSEKKDSTDKNQKKKEVLR